MDPSNLIDFSSPAETGSKLVLPLIQVSGESKGSYAPRLSDVDCNNPFDKVLRNITNEAQFERVLSSNFAISENEDKENCARLISPLQTPKRARKKKVLTKNPLFLDTSVTPQKNLDVSNVSLQCLSETFLNDFEESFSGALSIPLPNSSNEDLDESVNKPKMFRNLSQRLNASLKNIPSISINDNSSNSTLNQAFLDSKTIENSRIKSTKSSVDSLKNAFSFNLGTSAISSINPSFTSSQDICDDFDRAFLESKTAEWPNNAVNTRKCLTGQKTTKAELSRQYLACLPDKPKLKVLNNSFAGFNLTDRNSPHNVLEDSVFLEAQNLAHVFHNLANDTDELEDELFVCPAPWMSEDVNLCEDEEEEEKEITIEVSQNEQTSPEPTEKSSDSAGSKSSSSLLKTLREFMKSDGNEVDERKLEENLLSSLAKALHLNTSNHIEEAKSPENNLPESPKEQPIEEVKKIVPKLKTQSVRLTAPIKNKVKNVTAAKGPLKAMIPFTNMAKNRSSANVTPSKTLPAFQIKRASTPNEPKLKPPIAQSTPDVSKTGQQATPVKNRSFLYSLSPLSRRSTGDLTGEMNLNKSLSPNNISDSMPNNLNKSGSSLVKHGSNSSIPTMLYRRNSVGEKPDSSVLNRSYEKKPAPRPSLLKRSSSFQSKTSKSIPENNNEPKKKFGGFGMKMKTLSLVKK